MLPDGVARLRLPGQGLQNKGDQAWRRDGCRKDCEREKPIRVRKNQRKKPSLYCNASISVSQLSSSNRAGPDRHRTVDPPWSEVGAEDTDSRRSLQRRHMRSGSRGTRWTNGCASFTRGLFGGFKKAYANMVNLEILDIAEVAEKLYTDGALLS